MTALKRTVRTPGPGGAGSPRAGPLDVRSSGEGEHERTRPGRSRRELRGRTLLIRKLGRSDPMNDAEKVPRPPRVEERRPKPSPIA